MKDTVKNTDLENRVFDARAGSFKALALEIFSFQYAQNTVYRQYCDLLKKGPEEVKELVDIPFLPISFFKSHTVTTTAFEPEAVFESSGTTGTTTSRHYIRSLDLYQKSFSRCFEKFYGLPANKCILGLLPSYLERENSSLVFMTKELLQQSGHPQAGFYLDDHDKLYRALLHNEIKKQPGLLIGVTYALLDFAEKYSMQLRYTTVMETGGMKGRRQELTRQEVHSLLSSKLGVPLIHSEYGMTELLSQAYSKGDGIFHCPPWMQVLLREEDDPLQLQVCPAIEEKPCTGVINVIDLANIYSCSFIATEDVGRLYTDGSFEVLGRMDNSDVRGCSLMAV